MRDTLAWELGVAAKELAIGMWQRCERLPDVADYEVVFLRVLEREDAAKCPPAAADIKCEYCGKPASFVDGRMARGVPGKVARCIEHRFTDQAHHGHDTDKGQ